jgi:hypothetical protein
MSPVTGKSGWISQRHRYGTSVASRRLEEFCFDDNESDRQSDLMERNTPPLLETIKTSTPIISRKGKHARLSQIKTRHVLFKFNDPLHTALNWIERRIKIKFTRVSRDPQPTNWGLLIAIYCMSGPPYPTTWAVSAISQMK